jgi:hypothetical protein
MKLASLDDFGRTSDAGEHVAKCAKDGGGKDFHSVRLCEVFWNLFPEDGSRDEGFGERMF